ncbi:MAG: hypothetical protein OXI29_00165 [bacterium]|nr:hypothetical protein [bacterium]
MPGILRLCFFRVRFLDLVDILFRALGLRFLASLFLGACTWFSPIRLPCRSGPAGFYGRLTGTGFIRRYIRHDGGIGSRGGEWSIVIRAGGGKEQDEGDNG